MEKLRTFYKNNTKVINTTLIVLFIAAAITIIVKKVKNAKK